MLSQYSLFSFFPTHQMFKLFPLAPLFLFPSWLKKKKTETLFYILNSFKAEALWPSYDTLLAGHTKGPSEKAGGGKGWWWWGGGGSGEVLYIWHQLRNTENVCASTPPARIPHPTPSTLPPTTLIKKDVSQWNLPVQEAHLRWLQWYIQRFTTRQSPPHLSLSIPKV